MATQASWSGKVQIDGGQTLVLGDQMPLGVGPIFLGSDSLPVTLLKPKPEENNEKNNATTKEVRVLAAAGLAHLLAIKADAYGVQDDQGVWKGALQLTFKSPGDTDETKGKPITLSGDLLVAGKDILAAVKPGWVSIILSSTVPQDVSVQILVVREL